MEPIPYSCSFIHLCIFCKEQQHAVVWFVHRTWAPGRWVSGNGNPLQVLDILGLLAPVCLPQPPPSTPKECLLAWTKALSANQACDMVRFPLEGVAFLQLPYHCRWWLQPWNSKMLAPWKKSYDWPRQCIEKQRNYFVDNGPSSQGYGFTNVMYGWESWTIKKAEHRRIDAFELWCWRRLLRVPWSARRSNESILKEINPE